MKPNVLPTPDLGLEPHPAAEQRDDPPAQGQAETGALLALGAAPALLERLEDALPVLRRDAGRRCRSPSRHEVVVDVPGRHRDVARRRG